MDTSSTVMESNSPKSHKENKFKSLKTHSAQDVIKSMPLRFGVFIAITVLIELVYMMTIDVYFHGKLSLLVQALTDAVIGALAVSPVIWYLILNPVLNAMKKDQFLLKQQQDALEDEMERHELNHQLGKAFAMAETQPDIVKLFDRIATKIFPEIPVELLLADSSRAHMRLASSTVGVTCGQSGKNGCDSQKDEQGEENAYTMPVPMCNVATPHECIAARQGAKQIHEDSTAFDACPVLIDRGKPSMAAVCVPINIAGMTVGVIHSDVQSDSVNLHSLMSTFSVIAGHLGLRLGLVKAMDAAQQAAMTDPLTGLLNRRSLEDQCEPLVLAGRRLSVVVTDIDHFKKLNDTYSHAVGDRSLKAFAKALQKSCREHDIVARLGGEEFCLILLDMSAENAVQTLERIQKNLSTLLNQSGLPEFTASFGVTDTDFGDSLEGLIKVADNAMYEAKKAGRNRIIVASAKSKANQEPTQIAS